MIRNLFFCLIIFSFFSCKESSESSNSGNILENLTFTVDSVMIDSKGKFFDLRRGPHSSSISEDGKYLFLFNSNSRQIQQINLDELKWEKDIDFEVEGPNGISDVVFSTKALGDGKFLITAYRKMGIFDESGTKIKDFSISSLPISTDLQELDYMIILSKNQKNLFSLPGTQYEGPRTFARIDMESFEIENFKIPEMDWIFDIKFGMGGRVLVQEYMYLMELNNQVLALSPSASAFYRYDIDSDSLSYHSFVHKLSPVAIDIQLKGQVESDEEYREELRRFFMAFNFGPLIWDEKRELYFRFARKGKVMDDSYQITSSQAFMYAYDRDFKLIGEAGLPEISKSPSDPFFKDGKLWSYVNVDDELGFAVMDFKF